MLLKAGLTHFCFVGPMPELLNAMVRFDGKHPVTKIHLDGDKIVAVEANGNQLFGR